MGFSSKPTTRPSEATSRIPNRDASLERDRERGDREVVAALLVEREHGIHVHQVDVVAAENADVRRLLVEDQVEILVDGVRRAAEPVRPAAHLGRDRIDELPDVERESPGADDVLDERVRLELGEDLDLRETRVHEVVQDEVDDPVAAAERHGRLRAVAREWEQPLPHAAREDDGEHVAMLENLHAAASDRPLHGTASRGHDRHGASRVS